MMWGGPHITTPTRHLCTDSTHTHTLSQHCCALISQCIRFSDKYSYRSTPLWHCIRAEQPPQYLPYSQGLFLNASQSNGLFCQKLLGNDLFSRRMRGLQGCRFKSQSTCERFPIRCNVSTKGSSIQPGWGVITFHSFGALEIVKPITSVSAEVLSCSQQSIHRLYGYRLFRFFIRIMIITVSLLPKLIFPNGCDIDLTFRPMNINGT